MGRIRLENIRKIEEIPNNLTNEERDERIIESCIEYNAILLTGINLCKPLQVVKMCLRCISDTFGGVRNFSPVFANWPFESTNKLGYSLVFPSFIKVKLKGR